MRRGGDVHDEDGACVPEAGEESVASEGPTAAEATGELSRNAEEAILGMHSRWHAVKELKQNRISI